MLSPSSVFDVSPIRSFEQVGEMKSADRDSINVVYKFNFKSLNYPDGVILFTDSTTSFVMLMSSKNVALVLHNNSR
jgi:fumarylacetoacetate (FAA) hydrolase family protein